MQTFAGPAPNPIPPIILFVEDDRDTLEMYSAYFESSGMWAATSTTPGEALAAIDELRPDLLVTDVGFRGQPVGLELVHTLKTRSDTHQMPVIVLSGRSDLPAETRAEANVCLIKPVRPDALLLNVRRLLDESHALRLRGDNARAKTAELVDRSNRLLSRAKALGTRLEHSGRSCPECGSRLDWIERGRIAGGEYDYYRWCLKGCGLYCYDRDASKWVKLA